MKVKVYPTCSHPEPCPVLYYSAMKALWYTYRNLTSKCFSLKYKGKVVDHFTAPVIVIGGFKVSEKGRDMVRRTKKKFVHAYVWSKHEPEIFNPKDWEGWVLREVTYNPHVNEGFVFRDTGEVAEGNIIVMDFPKVFVITKGQE